MALSTATITGDISDMVGTDFDARRTKIWVTTNVPDDTVIDTVGNQIRLGSGAVTLNADGTFSAAVWIPGTGSNPASWQTTFHIDYPRANDRRRVIRDFGPFTITASADLADLVDEQEVPAEYLTTVTAALDAKVDLAEGFADDASTEADRAELAASTAVDISNISTSDGVVEALVKNTGGGGPLTSGALNALYGRFAGVQTTRTTDGAIVAMKHNPVDATSGNRAVTLADATDAGQLVALEKTDSSANTVTVTANIRGSAGTTRTLVGQYETLVMESKADGSWWPIASHKTKTYLDATYAHTSDAYGSVAIGSTTVVKRSVDAKGVGLGLATLPSVTTAINYTAIGDGALFSLTTGGNNMAIGRDTMRIEDAGGPSMAIGNEALMYHRGGTTHNVAVGLQSQRGWDGTGTAPNGSSVPYPQVGANVSLGVQTLWCAASGGNNVAIGFSALRYGIAPSNDIAIGSNALMNAGSSGSGGNIGIGVNTGMAMTSGATNTLVGHAAAVSLSTGGSNIVVGGNAAGVLAGGSNNTVMGVSAFAAAVSATTCVAIGNSALAVTTANSSTAVGNSALGAATSGPNQAFGFRAGLAIVGGINNTFVGGNAGNTDGTTATGASITGSTAIGRNAQATVGNVFVLGGALTADRVSVCIGNYGSIGGGKGLISLENAVTVPTSSNSTGGLMWVESGALKFRGSAGTVTTLAAA